MVYYANMLEAINGLRSAGYILDFNLGMDCIKCTESGSSLFPEEFLIDDFFRFEDFSNPDDSSILYAISSTSGLKGILVNAYGMYAEEIYMPILTRLASHNNK